MAQSPCLFYSPCWFPLLPFLSPLLTWKPSFVHLGLRLLVNWPPLPQPLPIPSPSQIPSTQVNCAPHYDYFKILASSVRINENIGKSLSLLSAKNKLYSRILSNKEEMPLTWVWIFQHVHVGTKHKNNCTIIAVKMWFIFNLKQKYGIHYFNGTMVIDWEMHTYNEYNESHLLGLQI